MNFILPSVGLILALALPARAQVQMDGSLELRADALSSTALTAGAARNYNVHPAPGRGLLTLTVARGGNGGAGRVPAQVYSGAINQSGHPMSIPIRAMRDGDRVLYPVEFLYQAPATLRFPVNVNVLGRQVSTEFHSSFGE